MQEERAQSKELLQENLSAALGCLNASALTKLLEQLQGHCCMVLNGIAQYVQAPCTAHVVEAEVDDVHHESQTNGAFTHHEMPTNGSASLLLAGFSDWPKVGTVFQWSV